MSTNRLLKDVKSGLLAFAAQTYEQVFACVYRAATLRERVPNVFQQPANECRRILGCMLMAAFFLTGCGLARVLGVGPGAHGSRPMDPVAPTHSNRASSFDLSKPDGAH
jgi:hypothetical protein